MRATTVTHIHVCAGSEEKCFNLYIPSESSSVQSLFLLYYFFVELAGIIDEHMQFELCFTGLDT